MPERPLADEQSQMVSNRLFGRPFLITPTCLSLDLTLPDQPNRQIRIRTNGGVGMGVPRGGVPIPMGLLSSSVCQ